MPETYQRIPVEAITPSPYQQRTMFGGQEDDELAESVGKHGVLQPIRVRQNGSPETFELVFGERRWRAAKAAGLVDVPAIVVSITDDRAIDEILIENLRRKDLHPLEEALGYQRLLNEFGYTMEALVSKTGKSKAHLYGRLKLTELAPGARKAFLEGKLAASIAELIARIPNPKLQEQATKAVLGEADWKDYDGTDVQPESIGTGRASDAVTQPLSFRAARAFIHKRYHLKLEIARFPTGDADLVPSAGACTTCPHRSGNQAELALPGEKIADDLCTNPPCFEAKTQAAWKRAADEAKGRGLDVIEGKKADAIFVWNGEVQPGSPYVDVDTRLPYDLVSPGSTATYGKMLGKRVAEIPRVLVQGPSGEPRELMVKAKALDVLREAGKLDKPSKPESASAARKSKEEKEAAKKAKAREEEKEQIVEKALTVCLEVAANVTTEGLGKKEMPFWKWVARSMVISDDRDIDLMLERRGLDTPDNLLALIEKTKVLADVQALIAEMVLASHVHVKRESYAAKEAKELLDDGFRLFGIDWENRVLYAKEEIREAKKKAEADKAAAKGARK